MSEPKSSLVAVGAIAGAHGVRGDVRIKSFTEDPETLFELGPLSDKSGRPLLTPKSVRTSKSLFIVTPQTPKSKEDWDSLRGTELFVPKSALPEPEEDDTFFVTDLVGMAAIDQTGMSLGKVHAVLNHGAGDVIELRGGAAGDGVMIPFTLQDVPEIDLKAKQITISSFELWTASADETDPSGSD